ncbi:DUF2158 domain-containing protein [Endozoicomonas acroporae]|uniref:DUF2158 domain-containing protein n=1 Tax=Endozoicomonas acroporae TaxID=1701104 RepID=UPI000C787957|nr:DUF2158 domain-containing protein [Endozoicomonas acroporae]
MEIRAKIGQLVRLRAGGPVLCVTCEYPMADGSYSYTCQWFEDDRLRDYTFPIVALEPVEGEFEASIKGQPGTEVEIEAEADTEAEAETEEGDKGKNYH